MRARTALCLSLAAIVTAAGVAEAAPRKRPVVKPVCNLVLDPAGDASVQGPVPSDDAVDIVGADIASDAKNFTSVIRIKNIGSSGLSQAGRDLQITFDLAGAEARVWMSYSSSAYGGDIFQYGLIGKGTGGSTSPTGPARGVVDTAKNEVRISVSTSEMAALGKAKPGSKVSNITAEAEQMVGLAPNDTGSYGYLPFAVDDATGTKAYITGSPSCVKPGA